MSGQHFQLDGTLGAVDTDQEDAAQTPRPSDFEQSGGRRMSLNDPISISVYSPSNAELSPRTEHEHEEVHIPVPTPSPPRSLREPSRNDLSSRSRSTERSHSGRSHGSSSDPPPPRVATQQPQEDESNASSRRRARFSHASAPPEILDDAPDATDPKPFTAVDPFAPRRHRLSWSSILKVKDGKRRPARNASDAWTHLVAYTEDDDPYTLGVDMEDRNSSEEAVLNGERLSGVPKPESQVDPGSSSVHPSASSASIQSSYHSFEEEKARKNATFQDSLPVYNSKPNGLIRDDTLQPAPSLRFGKQVTAETIPLNTIGASDTTSEAQEISLFAWLVAYFPARMYLYFLLGVPRLYFTRVANIFEDANLQKDQMERLVLQNASARRNPKLPAFRSEAFTQLTVSWTHFIDTLLREWKTMNLISVLLLSAIVAILQIEAAFLDPIVHYSALFSLISALMSLLYGCMYILRFNTMRMPHKAIQWAQEARKEQPNPFWNVWILLAIPAVWLVWSLLFYIICIMAFVWRVESGKTPPQFSDRLVLAIRIGISVALGVGIVYGVVVLRTFFNFGAAMDKRFKKSLDLFMKQQKQRLPYAHARPPTLKDIDPRWLQDQATHRDHYSETSYKSRASKPSMYSFIAYPVGVTTPNLPPPAEEILVSSAAGRGRVPHSHVHFKHSLDQVKIMTPVQEGLDTPHSINDGLTQSPQHAANGTEGIPRAQPPPSPAQELPTNPTSHSSTIQSPAGPQANAATPVSPDPAPSSNPPPGSLSKLSLPLSPSLSLHTRGATSSSTSSGQGTSARNSPSQRLPARRMLQPRRADTLPAEQGFQRLRSLEEGRSLADGALGGDSRSEPSRIQVSSAPLLVPPDPVDRRETSRPGNGLGIALAGSPTPWPQARPALLSKSKSKSSPDPDALSFSSASGPPYDALLPHAPYPVVYRSVQYPSALHLQYALPFLEHHSDVVERIRICNDPAELRLLSRNFATYLQPEDLGITTDKLIEVQTLKFRQHPQLARVLLGTGDRALIFGDSEDLALGVDRGGKGRNEFGMALMIARDELKSGLIPSWDSSVG